jgi:hypothetical protein
MFQLDTLEITLNCLKHQITEQFFLGYDLARNSTLKSYIDMIRLTMDQINNHYDDEDYARLSEFSTVNFYKRRYLVHSLICIMAEIIAVHDPIDKHVETKEFILKAIDNALNHTYVAGHETDYSKRNCRCNCFKNSICKFRGL